MSNQYEATCRLMTNAEVYEMEAPKRELWWTLRTRALTDEELQRVREVGYGLCIDTRYPYNEHEKRMEFNAALAEQARIRLLAFSLRDIGK